MFAALKYLDESESEKRLGDEISLSLKKRVLLLCPKMG
jgi:hypothetical protein